MTYLTRESGGRAEATELRLLALEDAHSTKDCHVSASLDPDRVYWV